MRDPAVEYYLGGGLWDLRGQFNPDCSGEVHPLSELVMGRTPTGPAIIVATAAEAQGIPKPLVDAMRNHLRLVVVSANPGYRLGGFLASILHSELPPLKPPDLLPLLKTAVACAAAFLALKTEQEDLLSEVSRLNRIGAALSTVRNSEELLDMILDSGRALAGCDAGSLYLVQGDRDGRGSSLLFAAAQNSSLSFPFKKRRMKLDPSSVAGYVALTGRELHIEDAYRIDHAAPYGFNRDLDRQSGYRTVNMLVVPMLTPRGEVRGVLQLINRTAGVDLTLKDPHCARMLVRPFDHRTLELVRSLASQAAVALDNTRLYEDIRRSFDGFVEAATVAIESRDPSTMGHSLRVANLSLNLAREVHRTDQGPLAGVHFDEADYQVIRYAALLHDFGKFGVPEAVLLKARKLPPGAREMVIMRARLIGHLLAENRLRRERDLLLARGRDEAAGAFDELEQRHQQQKAQLADDLAFILERDRAYRCEPGDAARINDIARYDYVGRDGEALSLITHEMARHLSIPAGTLTEAERTAMESHVEHSYRFLSRIPWSRELRSIPEVAYAHHEKLNGSGYPRHLDRDHIPVHARILVVADLFDALTAADRAYKKAMSFEKALSIIREEVGKGLVCPDVFQVFEQSRVYTRIHQPAQERF